MKKYVTIGGLVGLVLILAGLISYSINSVLNTLSTSLLIVGLALGIAFVVLKLEQIRSALSSRSVKFGSNVFLMSLIVLGILILINFITHQHNWRTDTTAAKQFSLAEQTKKIMKSLNKEVKLTAFFKPENEERMKDLVEEYAQLSKKLKYEFIDPDQDPATAKRYAQKGNLTYGTTIIECQGKEERITTVKEEDLTNAIIKVTREEVKKIYFTTGHGENDIDGESLDKNSYSTVKETIKKENYEVEKLLLAEKDAVPEDCAVLVISGPKMEFYPKEINMLEDYLRKGGKALFMLDPPIDQAPLVSLTDILEKWGVIVGNDLVVDAERGLLYV
ncbi:MAG: GldG family protein, partial [candidate division KSB1 bacterium]|nr:GldG family protein [candidate division KSB1 bacterium]